MKFLRDNDTKIIICFFGVTILIFCAIFFMVYNFEQRNYKTIFNNKVNLIVNNVKKVYPNVNEKDILDILNSNQNLNNNVLEKYGYNDEIIYVKQLKEIMRLYNMINILLLVLFGMILTLLFVIYVLRKNKKINQINKYIRDINNKKYTLDVEENEEGELSRLKNELYKITVYLKESSEISEMEKERLSNSITDISHQLKTPLTSIRIMLDNIDENPQMEEKTRKEFLKEISKQIDWISSLVVSLLKIAKFDAGAIKLEREKVNVKELMNNVINNLSIILDIKNISVVCNIDNDIEFVCDYKWEKEALTNILKNSIEHSKENSNIYINVDNNSLFLVIKIRDEGEGIDKEDIKYIFDRFYKSKNASDNSIGIGLSLAKAIIEKDNGYIDVLSKINEGTTFEIKYIK